MVQDYLLSADFYFEKIKKMADLEGSDRGGYFGFDSDGPPPQRPHLTSLGVIERPASRGECPDTYNSMEDRKFETNLVPSP